MSKYILGLDLGANSIGWAIVEGEGVEKQDGLQPTRLVDAGSRIIPMEASKLNDFERGNPISATGERTRMRGMRRMLERKKLRRQRIFRVLKTMGFLPQHFAKHVDDMGRLLPEGRGLSMAWVQDEGGKPLFIFEEAFSQMVGEFAERHPELLEGGRLIPRDWTLYYLRKKALTQRLEKEELAWVLASFNQKRGYHYMRGKDTTEEDRSKKKELLTLEVVDVARMDDGKGKRGDYEIVLSGEIKFNKKGGDELLKWKGQVKDFIVTTALDSNGNVKLDKWGKPSTTVSAPSEDDWELRKTKTEQDIKSVEGNSVGRYIYDSLLDNPDIKIIGQRVHVVGRELYVDELKRILKTQEQFHPELRDTEVKSRCAKALYESNEAHRNAIMGRSLSDIIVHDVVFYQRPLKSKKSTIADCPFEKRRATLPDGSTKTIGVKCISKSHPLFQEFRTWTYVSNMELEARDGSNIDTDPSLLGRKRLWEGAHGEEAAELFDFLHKRAKVTQRDVLKEFVGLNKSQMDKLYKWNYEEKKELPCCETHAGFLARFKEAGLQEELLTEEAEQRLWEITYSVTDQGEFVKALRSYARWIGADEEAFVKAFEKFKPYDSSYASYSAKAIKRLLPLMRQGHHWKWENIDPETQNKIVHLVTGEEDDRITEEMREKFKLFREEEAFQGLMPWQATLLVYGSSTSKEDIAKWESPADIDKWLGDFRQHSMRNPIVEQVVLETMRTVRDIWEQLGHIDEIHVEMARDMKKTAEERKLAADRVHNNYEERKRIQALLTEFATMDVEGVHPYSPMQQELLRIYEDGAFANAIARADKDLEDIRKIRSTFSKYNETGGPTHNDIVRYKLWLEQNYRSPYTGETIGLKRLFTRDYEIEHVIPQSRFFDDKMNNKVICEGPVNKLKGNMLGMEFIKKHGGEVVQLGGGRTVQILTEKAYCDLVRDTYKTNKHKMDNLLREDVPGHFSDSQMNNTRYITRTVLTLLSNIVRQVNADGTIEPESTAKRLIVCQGSVTDRLKKDWHVNDAWNRIIMPRYERMQRDIMPGEQFTVVSTGGHLIPKLPQKLETEGYNPKRIDHRHHAMDAIVIACATRNIVNFLNNENAGARRNYEELRRLLCVRDPRDGNVGVRMPWEGFVVSVQNALENIVVSFKHRQRVLTRTTNHYERFVDGKKRKVAQEGKNYAVRKSMHKDTCWGQVNLRRQKTESLNAALKHPQDIVDRELRKKIISLQAEGKKPKDIKQFFADNADVWTEAANGIAVWYFTNDNPKKTFATRFISSLTELFDKITTREKAEEKIETISDTGIQRILRAHIDACGGNVTFAFSPEGIEQMNANIAQLNGGKQHKPIKKVRRIEEGSKFSVGQDDGNRHKFVEYDKGSNLFFAVYLSKSTAEDGTEETKRSYATIPLRDVIERRKQGLTPVPETDEEGNRLLFSLSPCDLVYVPRPDEKASEITPESIDKRRIYMFVSSSGKGACFREHRVATSIVDKVEFSALNKTERAITREMIKEVCIPLDVDRLGNISIRKGV